MTFFESLYIKMHYFTYTFTLAKLGFLWGPYFI